MSRVDRYEYTDWKGFGKRVADSRKQIGLSKEKFAEMTNRSENYISELQKGNRGCSIHTLHQVARALKVSTDSLLYGDIPNEDKKYENKEILLEIIKRCDDEEVAVIKDMVVALYPNLKHITEKKNSK